jgi:hypothetical protein
VPYRSRKDVTTVCRLAAVNDGNKVRPALGLAAIRGLCLIKRLLVNDDGLCALALWARHVCGLVAQVETLKPLCPAIDTSWHGSAFHYAGERYAEKRTAMSLQWGPMLRYHVHFSADHLEPLPPVATLASIEAEDPPSAVEALLAAGRVPQALGLRWARVVTAVHDNGVPKSVVRFPLTWPSKAPRLIGA